MTKKKGVIAESLDNSVKEAGAVNHSELKEKREKLKEKILRKRM